MKSIERRSRRWLAGAAGTALVVAGLTTSGLATAAPHTDSADDKVHADVTETLQADGSADVWVQLADRADLSAAAGMGWQERGQFVYSSLREHAAASQAELVADLDAQGVDYQTYWINNTIFIEDADAGLVGSLAADAQTLSIGPDFTPYLIEPVTAAATNAPLAVEWGVADIGADEIWDTYGTTGEGIVIGTLDTGVEYTHPALNASYRGTETGNHDYNWFDSGSVDSDIPVDPHGHGTHVNGTVVGEDGENQIGVAPGAQWIASAGCCISGANVFDAMEWFLAPTPIGSDDGDPDMRPHVVNNSWGFDGQFVEPVINDAIAAWIAAGIFPVFAAGNDGPGCDTVLSPAWNDGAYSVGNYQQDHTIHPTSSRGLGEDDEPGVDIAAPGTNIRSSWPGGGYENLSGTSMAAPHVTGGVALLWSEFPHLVGNVDATIELLDETAIDTADPTCGGPVENNPTFGEGRLDLPALFAAVDVDENNPPVVEDQTLTTVQDTPVSGTVEASDPDGDEITLTFGEPANGTVENDGADFTYTPDAGFTGTDFFQVTASDGELEGSGTVTIEVNPVLPDRDVVRWWSQDPSLDNRYETAAAIAREFPDGVDTVYLASGQTYVDALPASALAAQTSFEPMLVSGAPLLLVQQNHLPSATAAVLADLDPANIIVIGSEETISSTVYDAAGATGRLSGDNRYETAVAISEQFDPGVPVAYVANGNIDSKAADALVAAARAGHEGGPVLLTRDDQLPSVVAAELERLAPGEVIVLGGEDAVSAEALAQVSEAAGVEATRLGGADRWETAVLVSSVYAPDGEQVLIANGNNWPDTLAGAAYAGAVGAPIQIVRTDHIPAVTFAELNRLSPEQLVILGSVDAVDQSVEDGLHYVE